MSEGVKYFYKGLEGWTEINRFGLQTGVISYDMPGQPPTNLIRTINKATQPRHNGRLSTLICNHNAKPYITKGKAYCSGCFEPIILKDNKQNEPGLNILNNANTNGNNHISNSQRE